MRKTSRTMFAGTALAVGLTLSLLSGCASASQPAETAASATDASADLSGKVRIGVAAPAAGLLLPFLALNEGIFAENGLTDVEVTFMPGPQLIPAAAGGAFEVAITSPPSAELTSLQTGGALQTIATWGANPGQVLVVSEDIKSVEDLKGRKVGINGSTAGSSSILSGYALREAGMTFDDVDLVVLQDAATQVQAFIGGQVDAQVTGEPFLSTTLESRPGSHVIETFDDLSYFPTPEVIGTTTWLDSKPDQAAAVLTSLQEALELWVADPAAAKKEMQTDLKLQAGDPLIDHLYDYTINDLFLDGLEPVTKADTVELFGLLRDSGFPQATDDLAETVVDESVYDAAFGK